MLLQNSGETGHSGAVQDAAEEFAEVLPELAAAARETVTGWIEPWLLQSPHEPLVVTGDCRA